MQFRRAWTAIPVIALFCLFLSFVASAKEYQWNKAESPNFIVYTLEGEKDARRAALQFEQVKANLETIGFKVQTPKKVVVVSFGGRPLFQQYLPQKGNIAAFYQRGMDQDYIIMRDVNYDTFPTAIHEFVHLLVQYSGLKVPVWFNEGLAEFYSSLRNEGKKVLIGGIPPYRLTLLNQSSLIPLADFLSVDRKSSLYNESDRRGVFYAQSWALVHMLRMSPEYREKNSAIFAHMKEKTLTAADFERALERPLATIEKDLKAYTRQTEFLGSVMDAKLEQVESRVSVISIAESEARLTLACVLASGPSFAKAEPVLLELQKNDPTNLTIIEKLAVVAMYGQKDDLALERLEEADGLGSTNVKLMLQYVARKRSQSDGPEARATILNTLQRLAKDNGENVEVALSLASSLNREQKAVQALVALNAVKTVKPDDAFHLFRARAYTQLNLKNLSETQKEIANARKYAEGEQLRELDVLEESVRRMESFQRGNSSSTTVSSRKRFSARSLNEGSNEPPRLRKHIEEASKEDQVQEVLTPQYPSETGSFVELDCRAAKTPVVRVRVGAETLGFAILNPNRIQIQGAGSETIDLNCGPQKSPKKVEVSFRPEADAKLRSRGELLILKLLD
jgi:hypothetical protein